MGASYDRGLRKWRRDPQSKLTRETGHIRKFWIGLEMGLNSGRSRSLDSLHRSSASKYVCICGHAPIYTYAHIHICTCMPQTQIHMHTMKKQKFPHERMKLPTSLNCHPSEPVHFVAVPSNERDAQAFMPDTLVLKKTHPWMFESWAEPTPFFIKYPLFEKKNGWQTNDGCLDWGIWKTFSCGWTEQGCRFKESNRQYLLSLRKLTFSSLLGFGKFVCILYQSWSSQERETT